VGQRIISLSETGGGTAAAPAPAQTGPQEARSQAGSPRPPAGQLPEPDAAGPATKRQVAAAPSIRRMADELGIDLSRFVEVNEADEIVLSDVRTYIRNYPGRHTAQGGLSAPEKRPGNPLTFPGWGGIYKKPMSTLASHQPAHARKLERSRISPSLRGRPHLGAGPAAKILRPYEKQAPVSQSPRLSEGDCRHSEKHPIFNPASTKPRGIVLPRNITHRHRGWIPKRV